MDVVALVVAAGRGTRAGLDVPKQYSLLAGQPVLRRTLQALSSHPEVDAVLTVIGPTDTNAYSQAVDGVAGLLPAVRGGATRQESVRNGLEELAASSPRLVLVHDGARPFVSRELVSRVIEACDESHGAVPALAVTDTIKRRRDDRITATVPREDLVTAQTPQGFPFAALLEAHRQAARSQQNALTDDAAVADLVGLPVRIVEGDPRNVKLTRPADFADAERALWKPAETRSAQGFDVHAVGPGSSLWLCGVEIPHDRGLLGHSDADVGLHALTDAILGAIADGDIGQHFPPSDPKWKGAASDQFLADAVRRLDERHGRVVHLDVTIVCETPKVGPHRDAMRAAIARIAGVAIERVSVKATTSERLGFTGRGEGIAALASATVELPRAE
jgi:2-C-methyl-D-erythritol 4-phosphate cytidylyltransferase / 2-C-methyl-D-erythritol 2,4-cyclodiphosphate synthase